jgi:hypothetical protein
MKIAQVHFIDIMEVLVTGFKRLPTSVIQDASLTSSLAHKIIVLFIM